MIAFEKLKGSRNSDSRSDCSKSLSRPNCVRPASFNFKTESGQLYRRSPASKASIGRSSSNSGGLHVCTWTFTRHVRDLFCPLMTPAFRLQVVRTEETRSLRREVTRKLGRSTILRLLCSAFHRHLFSCTWLSKETIVLAICGCQSICRGRGRGVALCRDSSATAFHIAPVCRINFLKECVYSRPLIRAAEKARRKAENRKLGLNLLQAPH